MAAGELDVSVQGLRSDRGLVRICITNNPSTFPRCHGDPMARRLNVPAAQAASLHFRGMQTGDYAIAVLHDENGNGQLDTFLGVPREGFGFSRNPGLTFGPPPFDRARFALGPEGSSQVVRLRYLI